MDYQELNADRRMVSSANKVNDYLDRGFSERAKSVVTNHAICGGIALALPLFGLDNVIYLVALWHMYIKLCDLANKSFGDNKTKSFIGAVIVNFIVAFVLELACNVLPVAGGIIGGFIIGFVSIKVSGAAYLKALEIAHEGDVAERYRLDRIFSQQTQNSINNYPTQTRIPPVSQPEYLVATEIPNTYAPSREDFRSERLSMLTEAEQEYIDEYNQCLGADGNISAGERRLLDRLRVKLGISEIRAAELEMLTA